MSTCHPRFAHALSIIVHGSTAKFPLDDMFAHKDASFHLAQFAIENVHLHMNQKIGTLLEVIFIYELSCQSVVSQTVASVAGAPIM